MGGPWCPPPVSAPAWMVPPVGESFVLPPANGPLTNVPTVDAPGILPVEGVPQGLPAEDAPWSLPLEGRMARVSFDIVTQGRRTIGSEWVYKVKLKSDGSLDRCKGRLEAKGFNQVARIDYTEYFSPIAKAVTVRVFLAIASAKGWPIYQLDVNNALLHGYLDEEVYINPPNGYEAKSGMFLALIIYVEDILVTSTRLEIARSHSGTFVSQQKYATDLVTNTGLSQSRSASTPLPPGIELTQGAEGFLTDPESYCRVVGSLLQLGVQRHDASTHTILCGQPGCHTYDKKPRIS
ncbi:hypothetical protein Sango_1026600 [Sesamum angolense]|uniref:Reverse transcriptase Ty1/copia-type domain-containing protein n=1 Tax=Sesamum angolense TaxID=2727404 RepID=A0AAE2BYY3_9LAMI|nr:hypothetical protein Sango_1026600 [Sesamum angolense]